MRLATTLAATLMLGLAAATAVAHGDRGGERGEGRHHGFRGASVERTAMHNILIDKLSQRTGKTPAELNQLLDDRGPHEAAEQLGLDGEAMRALFEESRLQLIQRSTDAGLITAAQAEQLRTTQPRHRFGRHGGGHGGRHGEGHGDRRGNDDRRGADDGDGEGREGAAH